MKQKAKFEKADFIVFFMIIFLFPVSHCLAQVHHGRQGPADGSDNRWSSSIRGGSIYQFDTDMDNSGRSFTAHRLLIQPGIAAFITDLVSFEVGTSILGLSSKYTTTTFNGDKDSQGTKFSNDVSFEIDLLSLFLGITFYFPVK